MENMKRTRIKTRHVSGKNSIDDSINQLAKLYNVSFTEAEKAIKQGISNSKAKKMDMREVRMYARKILEDMRTKKEIK